MGHGYLTSNPTPFIINDDLIMNVAELLNNGKLVNEELIINATDGQYISSNDRCGSMAKWPSAFKDTINRLV